LCSSQYQHKANLDTHGTTVVSYKCDKTLHQRTSDTVGSNFTIKRCPW